MAKPVNSSLLEALKKTKLTLDSDEYTVSLAQFKEEDKNLEARDTLNFKNEQQQVVGKPP
jgi:hypothetical protein